MADGVERGTVQRAGVWAWFPGLRVARTYRRSWFRPDVVAGLILTALVVPQGMAYAELAHLPPVTGLVHDGAGLDRLCRVRPVARSWCWVPTPPCSR